MAIPVAGEDAARGFYGDLLRMEEITKPRALADRGGCWFRAETAEIHCGVAGDFVPALKAHPALEVNDFDETVERFQRAELEIRPDELFPGRRRFYVDDPFGNRVEILERMTDGEPAHPFVFGACYRVLASFGISAPNAEFLKGQLVRFAGYSGYSRWDEAHVYLFSDAATGAHHELWWFTEDALEAVIARFEPTWCVTE